MSHSEEETIHWLHLQNNKIVKGCRLCDEREELLRYKKR